MTNLLITSASGMGYPSLVRCFNPKKFRIIGTASSKDAVGFAFVSKGYVIANVESNTYVTDLFKICKKERVDILIPVNPKELVIVTSRIKEFEKIGTKILISPLQSIEDVEDKERLFLFCQKEGIPTPAFIKVKKGGDFKKAVTLLGYPKQQVCFKPKISSGTRGFRILSANTDRLDALMKDQGDLFADFFEVNSILNSSKKIPEMLVMEYLPGQEYSVDILADHGKAQVIIPRLREKIVLGASFVGTVVRDKEIEKYSRKITEHFKLHGVIGIQFRRDKNNVPKVLEVNPRMQGALILTVAAGANLPELSVERELGKQWKEPAIQWGTKLIRYYDEVYQNNHGKFFRI